MLFQYPKPLHRDERQELSLRTLAGNIQLSLYTLTENPQLSLLTLTENTQLSIYNTLLENTQLSLYTLTENTQPSLYTLTENTRLFTFLQSQKIFNRHFTHSQKILHCHFILPQTLDCHRHPFQSQAGKQFPQPFQRQIPWRKLTACRLTVNAQKDRFRRLQPIRQHTVIVVSEAFSDS